MEWSDEQRPDVAAGRERKVKQLAIDKLLDSLTPRDATETLFSFEERKRWNIRRHRRHPE